MSILTDQADQVWRDYEVDGNPDSGSHKPVKSEIRDLFGLIESNIPAYYGAVGDGITDDTNAILAALMSGWPIDGQGLTYAISSLITVATGAGKLRNAKFTCLAWPAGIKFSGLDDVEIRGCTIDCGGFTTVGTFANFALHVHQCGNALVEHNRVHNGGPISGIVVEQCDIAHILNNVVEDCIGDQTPAATNDAIQGFYIVANNNCTVFGNTVRRLRVYMTPVAGPNAGIKYLSTRFARGFAFGGVSGISNDKLVVTHNYAELCDQTFDFTGGDSSTNVTFAHNISEDAGSFAFKATGHARHIRFLFNHAIRPGKEGIIVSGLGTDVLPYIKTIDIIGNLIEEPGNDGLWTDGTIALGGIRGIHIAGGVFLDPSGVQLALNRVDKDPDNAYPMSYGFLCEADVDDPDGDDVNITIDELLGNGNTVTGATLDFSGFQEMGVDLTGASNEILATETWQGLSCTDETRDTAHIHDDSGNAPLVYVKRSGWWLVHGLVTFPANATGVRKIKLLVSGVDVPGAIAIFAPHATEPTTATLTTTLYVERGDNITFRMWQNTGGNLTIDKTLMRVSAKYMGF